MDIQTLKEFNEWAIAERNRALRDILKEHPDLSEECVSDVMDKTLLKVITNAEAVTMIRGHK